MPTDNRNSFEWFATIRKFLIFEAYLYLISVLFNLIALASVGYVLFRYNYQGEILLGDFGAILLMTVAGLLGFNTIHHFLFLWTRTKRRDREKEPSSGKMKTVHDPHSFRGVLRHEVKRAGRYHFPVTLCLVELDNRDAFHQKHGKTYTNRVHEKFEAFVTSIIRTSDYLCRLDNDRFFILLCHTNLASAEFFIYRLLIQSQERMELSFSSGLTNYRTGEDMREFVERCERALLKAKHQGIKKTHCAIGKDDQQVIKTF